MTVGIYCLFFNSYTSCYWKGANWLRVLYYSQWQFYTAQLLPGDFTINCCLLLVSVNSGGGPIVVDAIKVLLKAFVSCFQKCGFGSGPGPSLRLQQNPKEHSLLHTYLEGLGLGLKKLYTVLAQPQQ